MWYRGRSLFAVMVLTAIAASIVTYTVVKLPDWALQPSAVEAGASSSGSAEGWSEEELGKLNKALDLIEERYMTDTDRSQLLDGAVQGMVESLRDPYSVYKSSEEAQKFSDALQGAFTGIGAELKIENGTVVVDSAIKGSPAERAGLQPRDVLLSVNGQSLHGVTLSEAVSKIRGPKGTKAKLKISRAGAAEPLELEMVRDRIDLETVHADLGQDGIGRLSINQFTYDTSAEVADRVRAMEEQGLKALIIDVRDNPGGILQSVLEVSEQFIEKNKPILVNEYRDGRHKTEFAVNGLDRLKPYPIIVLINKGSASAAEILAGALKQSANAVLVGDTSYGKGTVQVSYDKELGDGSLVKLTVYKWLLPDGTWIHQKGIDPDLAVSQPDYFLASRLPRDHVLQYDVTGEPVKNLQNILEGIGFPADRKDGYFSKGTEAAVQQFQLSEQLPVDGQVNAATADRLEEKLYVNLQNPEYDTQWQAAVKKARELMPAS
ncbi:peptidase S41 [Cohnella kolymensis]|uniref:Peptidase S41 n=1 Tax=Cohnella kolymensis TaxID=1590652 RepID=A0ABR5A6N9_9BACL|nr:S41 family peptidase [Cohnella kolymensis]KIL36716.1 peptidase S41 [Cohnella kolymensis]